MKSEVDFTAKPNWQRLETLRDLFLGGHGIFQEYWDEELLALYDLTFAQRILWKWLAVLEESLPKLLSCIRNCDSVLDFGCGTAIASTALLERLSKVNSLPQKIYLWDRSPLALKYAKSKIENLFPSLNIQTSLPPPEEHFLFLASHVLGELKENDLGAFQAQLENCQGFLCVEPGTPFHSKRIISLREPLLPHFNLMAPCPHQSNCGLNRKQSADWCHHFAPVPAHVFQDSFWREFSTRLKIDLRSLPISYLVGARKFQAEQFPPSSKRIIGRPRIHKGFAKALVCTESGVLEEKFLQREHKLTIKQWAKASLALPID